MTTPPYANSDEHLWEELRRVDRLVRAQTVRWRRTIGASKPEHLWGMLHVSDAEVDAFLRAPFAPLHCVSGEDDPAATALEATAEDERRQIDARLRATPPDVPLRLRRLVEALALSGPESDALLLCLLPELDCRYRRLYGYLQDDVSQASPSVELLLQLLSPVAPGRAGRATVEGGSRLLACCLLMLPDDRQDPRPAGARPVRIDDRVAAHLLGSDAPDRRLNGILAEPPGPRQWEEIPLEPDRLADLQRLAAWLKRRAAPETPAPVLLLEGPEGSGRLDAAQALCTAADIPLLVADADAALRVPIPFDDVVGLCVREAALRDAALCWARCEALLEPGQPRSRSDRVVEAAGSLPGPVLLASSVPWDRVQLRARPLIRFAFAKPAYGLRHRLWERCLPAPGDFAEPAPARAKLADHLANRFRLTHGQMLDAVAAARAEALRRDPMDPRLTAGDLHEGCRRQSARHLDAFARRIEPATALTFDDLILPKNSRRQLDELRHRIGHHGRVHVELGFERRLLLGGGLVAMFTGGSGTGKTMAAQLLAGEQGVDLYKIDLSELVSKWVGETERNLSQLFAHAEAANALLFFDEADALFGRRGEVRDARDRWANVEVDYLLQRIEEYPAPVILATNLSQNIDPAFLRRIHVIVEFPFPDAESRFAIWRGMFPSGIQRPTDDDLCELARRFALPGGSIRNIVVDAAFRALTGNGHGAPTVTLGHLAIATAREQQKLGKPLTRAEFGEELYRWVDEGLLKAGR